MKKGLLIGALALAFGIGLQAKSDSDSYDIKIDNDLDGKERTDVRVTLISNPFAYLVPLQGDMTFTLKGGNENRVKIANQKPIRIVRVAGISGYAEGQQAVYHIPDSKVGSNIKIDVDLNEQGQLMLSEDKD